jgi:hypothetical protein
VSAGVISQITPRTADAKREPLLLDQTSFAQFAKSGLDFSARGGQDLSVMLALGPGIFHRALIALERQM